MPEIILANLWNLTRRYAPELRFITSAGECREALCRRRNYTSHDGQLFAQANRLRLAEVDSEIIFRLIAETAGEPERMKLALETLQGDLPFGLEIGSISNLLPVYVREKPGRRFNHHYLMF